VTTKNKQLVIFIGPPGSGKGSLSQLCVQSFGWKQLSTGSLCRKHIKEQTEIGKQIDFSIKSGKLISDDLIVGMVEQWLVESTGDASYIILDGFPRNVGQAEALHDILTKKLIGFTIVVFKLFASDEVVSQRILARSICENQDCQAVYSVNPAGLIPKVADTCNYCSTRLVRRTDDQKTTILNRLKTYRTYENDLIEFYEDKGLKVKEINVEDPLERVFQSFKFMVSGSDL